MLVGSLGVDPKEGAKIAYHDFIEAIRMGKVKYITTGRRGRMGPDPDAPIGGSNSATRSSLPYGTMHDVERNLETHDTNVENMFQSLENIFQNYALPEFFKPKTIRQSQMGAIWAWKPAGPLGASKPGTPARAATSRPTTSTGWQK